MSYQFNPITGQLDLVSQGGVLDGEVETFADLPVTVPDPPIGSTFYVKNSSGVWLVNRKQSGIWIRKFDTGVRETDWTYGGDYPVTSVNGKSGAVVLGATDVSATPALEYISQTPSTVVPIDVLANKHYTFIKTVSGTLPIYLPTTANDGDRVVVRSASVWSAGAITVNRLGGNPAVQTIGVLTGPNAVFYAVWAGLWRQDFVPPAGFPQRPQSTSFLGSQGQLAYEDPHLYICVNPNTWRRVTLTTF